MHKTLFPVMVLLGVLVLPELAIAETPTSETTAEEAGQIKPGLFWNHIYAAYLVTWLSIIGYTISLWVRRGKGATK